MAIQIAGLFLGVFARRWIPYIRKLKQGKIKGFDKKFLKPIYCNKRWNSTKNMPHSTSQKSSSILTSIASFFCCVSYGIFIVSVLHLYRNKWVKFALGSIVLSGISVLLIIPQYKDSEIDVIDFWTGLKVFATAFAFFLDGILLLMRG